MSDEIPNIYTIKYSNNFEFERRKLAFRKHKLFDITTTPFMIPFNEHCDCWLINRKQLSKAKAKELIKMESITIDVSDLQWYQQIELDEVFNL